VTIDNNHIQGHSQGAVGAGNEQFGGREISPSMDEVTTRPRSRSKPPPPPGASTAGKSRLSKKRASISGIDRPHPPAIMIPSNVTSNGVNGGGSRPSTSDSSPPMSAPLHQTMMGWSNHQPAYSLPTSNGLIHTHKYGIGLSPHQHAKKEESPELDVVSKQ
jgi:hypothetical protein